MKKLLTTAIALGAFIALDASQGESKADYYYYHRGEPVYYYGPGHYYYAPHYQQPGLLHRLVDGIL